MQNKMREFAASLGLELNAQQTQQLAAYAELVWEKKGFLNLTSVADKEEIFTRHICDGLAAAAFFKQAAGEKKAFSLADMGSGAGYIGLACAVALPQARVSLVDSLEKRCSFLNWAVLKLGLKNVSVVCMRLGQKQTGPFDFVTERAMGQINDILPLVACAVKEGGLFAAYQSQPAQADRALAERFGLMEKEPVAYTLPGEEKARYLAVFAKQAPGGEQ